MTDFHEAFANLNENDEFGLNPHPRSDPCNTKGIARWETLAHYYPFMIALPKEHSWVEGKGYGITPWGRGMGNYGRIPMSLGRHLDYGWKRRVVYEWNCSNGKRLEKFTYLGIATKAEYLR